MTTPTVIEEQLSKLDACIHCGMCLPACPTYQVTGSEAESPRGRLYLMRAYLEDNLESPEQLSHHLDPCLGCQACMTACPSSVNYEALLMHSRQELVQYQSPIKRKIRRFLLQKVLNSPQLLEFIADGITALDKMGARPIWETAIGKSHKLFKPLQFVPKIQIAEELKPGMVFGTAVKGKVALFTGCIMNAAFRQTHWATIDVLVQNGYQVSIPEQSCCGALSYHAGEIDLFQEQIAKNWPWMTQDQYDYIVINSAGCGNALKAYEHEGPQVNTPEAKALSTKIIDIMALLAKHPLEGELNPLPLTATYHAACHLHHGQGIKDEPYEVLKQIPELKLVPLKNATDCCGSAGIYNIAHPEMSIEILKSKMRYLFETQANIVVTGNPGCMLQLEAGLRHAKNPMLVAHPVELVQMAYNKPKAQNNKQDTNPQDLFSTPVIDDLLGV